MGRIEQLRIDVAKKISIYRVVEGIARKLKRNIDTDDITTSIISPDDYPLPQDQYEIDIMRRLRIIRVSPPINQGDGLLYGFTSTGIRLHKALVDEGYYKRMSH